MQSVKIVPVANYSQKFTPEEKRAIKQQTQKNIILGNRQRSVFNQLESGDDTNLSAILAENNDVLGGSKTNAVFLSKLSKQQEKPIPYTNKEGYKVLKSILPNVDEYPERVLKALLDKDAKVHLNKVEKKDLNELVAEIDDSGRSYLIFPNEKDAKRYDKILAEIANKDLKKEVKGLFGSIGQTSTNGHTRFKQINDVDEQYRTLLLEIQQLQQEPKSKENDRRIKELYDVVRELFPYMSAQYKKEVRLASGAKFVPKIEDLALYGYAPQLPKKAGITGKLEQLQNARQKINKILEILNRLEQERDQLNDKLSSGDQSIDISRAVNRVKKITQLMQEQEQQYQALAPAYVQLEQELLEDGTINNSLPEDRNVQFQGIPETPQAKATKPKGTPRPSAELLGDPFGSPSTLAYASGPEAQDDEIDEEFTAPQPPSNSTLLTTFNAFLKSLNPLTPSRQQTEQAEQAEQAVADEEGEGLRRRRKLTKRGKLDRRIKGNNKMHVFQKKDEMGRFTGGVLSYQEIVDKIVELKENNQQVKAIQMLEGLKDSITVSEYNKIQKLIS